MTLFQYTALGPDGRRRTDRLEAIDETGARRQVAAAGEHLIEIRSAANRSWHKFERKTDISPRGAGEFALELAGLLSAGAPLRKALDIQSAGIGISANLATSVLRNLDNGGSLSAGLRATGGGARLLAEFVEAGEAGAGLDELLRSGGQFLQARSEALEKIKSALAYPVFILILVIVALAVITLFVAPALAPTLEESGQGGLIIWMAGFAEFVSTNSQPLTLASAGVIGLGFVMLRRPVTRKIINHLVWRLPFFGAVARDLETGQSCSVLAALLDAGRSLESALKYAAGVSGPQLSAIWSSLANRLRDGDTASAAFNAEPALPLEVRRLALLGERSSAFPQAMRQAGEICHTRAMRRIDRIAAVFGPALVIGLGAGISLLMLSVLGSLSSIGDIVS